MKLSKIDPLRFRCSNYNRIVCEEDDESAGQVTCESLQCCYLTPEDTDGLPGDAGPDSNSGAAKKTYPQPPKLSKADRNRNLLISETFITPIIPTCPIHDIGELSFVIVPSHSPLPPKFHCEDCLDTPGAEDSPVDVLDLIFAGKNFISFRSAYNRFDSFCEKRQAVLGFRGDLDEFIGLVVGEFAARDLSGVFKDSSNLRFSQHYVFDDEIWVIAEDRRLVHLAALLDRLMVAFETHSQEFAVQRLADYVAEFLEIDPQNIFFRVEKSGRDKAGKTTRDLRTLFAKRWPIIAPELNPIFPAGRPYKEKLSSGSLSARSKQVAHVEFGRKNLFWQNLVRQSRVLRQSDIPFLLSQFPDFRDFHFLARVEDEAESPEEFRRKISHKPQIILLVDTGDRRFGFFSARPYPYTDLHELEGARLFSLTNQQVYPLAHFTTSKLSLNPGDEYFGLNLASKDGYKLKFQSIRRTRGLKSESSPGSGPCRR